MEGETMISRNATLRGVLLRVLLWTLLFSAGLMCACESFREAFRGVADLSAVGAYQHNYIYDHGYHRHRR